MCNEIYIWNQYLQGGTQEMKSDIEIPIFIICIAAIGCFYLGIGGYHLVRDLTTYFSPKICRKYKLVMIINLNSVFLVEQN